MKSEYELAPGDIERLILDDLRDKIKPGERTEVEFVIEGGRLKAVRVTVEREDGPPR